ncbi:hypothetical protein [Maribacter cobaltidurans]|uniref:hypothetical protein n=1 Tax=Maribacter cobaltidurans TaxID=1178778 RepID=UPI0013152728|nr:hypothetical protein [Maribacter cobaltidurans]GGD97912.1 hypothetical protein GCM10011412_39970 [Maribacter cobaltidurans]|tara:strand:- start:1 stop:492 length:492 start_codon:yes stop_codon:yes gene_type:complete
MKKLLILFLIGILFTSCSSDDDNGIDCSLFDPAFPELYIRLVDETGTNLIENGTIDPENITVEGDFSNPGFQYIPPNEFAEPDADIRKYDKTLYLFIPNESNFKYTINLDDSTSIILNFEARFAELPCEVSYYIPTKLTFNNQNVESENAETDELIFLAEIKI